jgi:hypothetical protein
MTQQEHNTMKTSGMAILVLTVLACTSAQADGPGGQGQNNGKGGPPDFASIDTDGNGELSYEEMSAGPRGAPPQEMFDELDADDNGQVSKQEMQNMRGRHGRGPGSKNGAGNGAGNGSRPPQSSDE